MAIGRIPEPGTGIPESIIAAKGDLLTGTANDTPAVLSVGTNGHTLVANSATATGLEWAAPAGGGGMTSIASGSLSNAALSLTTISGSYKSLYLVLTNFTNASGFDINMRVNADSTSGRYAFILTGVRNDVVTDAAASTGQSSFGTSPAAFKASANANFVFTFHNYASSTATKIIEYASIGNDNTNNVPMVGMGTAMYTTTTAITGISTTGTVVSGDYTLYGVN
jgi:hypothetical protein